MAKSICTTTAIDFFKTFGLEALNNELDVAGMPAQDSEGAAATLVAARVRTLDEWTATTVNLSGGELDREKFNKGMVDCFPQHTIKVKQCAHYLSLARRGALGGGIECRFTPPHAERKGKNKFIVKLDVRALTDEQFDALVAVGIEMPAKPTN